MTSDHDQVEADTADAGGGVAGPLAGLRILEIASMGPGPHACMVLADLGAEIVRVARPGDADPYGAGSTHTGRGRQRRFEADLKSSQGRDEVLAVLDEVDVLVEGFRPGVMERLGLGPEVCHARNPGLVYARVTGWGQTGPLARRAGHDINYVSVTGMLHAIGPSDRPIPPLNLVGDFGGGSMFAVVGILAALWERQRSGLGDVVDVAMVDGVSALSQAVWEMRDVGDWNDNRADNVLDGAAPFYRTYRCSDGGFIAVGCIEEPFYRQFVDGLDVDVDTLPDRGDRTAWAALAEIFQARIATRTREAWIDVFADTDACVSPVLSFDEVPDHPHVAARASVVTANGKTQASPAPRFERSEISVGRQAPTGVNEKEIVS